MGIEPTMIDLSEAEAVQIRIDSHNKLWVNVDGQCLLRIQKAKAIEVEEDGRNILFRE